MILDIQCRPRDCYHAVVHYFYTITMSVKFSDPAFTN